MINDKERKFLEGTVFLSKKEVSLYAVKNSYHGANTYFLRYYKW